MGFLTKHEIKKQEEILEILDNNIMAKEKEYKELDLKYRELLTKYAIIDNIEELILRKRKLFEEIEILEAKLNNTKVKVKNKEMSLPRYDAKKLLIAITYDSISKKYSVNTFTYLKNVTYRDEFLNAYSNCQIYKDINDANRHFGIDGGKIVKSETNVCVLGWISYLKLADLINQVLPKDKSVTIMDINEALSVFDNYDLTKVNMAEIYYSLKSIKTNGNSRKRELK